MAFETNQRCWRPGERRRFGRRRALGHAASRRAGRDQRGESYDGRNSGRACSATWDAASITRMVKGSVRLRTVSECAG